MVIVNYLNKLSRDIGNQYGFQSQEYIEFKQFYDEVAGLIKYKSEIGYL